MAESRAKIEFQTTKKLFEAVAENVVCYYCKVVPRKGPIYQYKHENFIACEECLPKIDVIGFERNETLEKMLFAFPITSCKFRKNDCKVVQDLKNIEYHEEDCEFRDIMCPAFNCEDIIFGISNFEYHFDDRHSIDIKDDHKHHCVIVQENVLKLKACDFGDFLEDIDVNKLLHFFPIHEKLFLVHIDRDPKNRKNIIFWIQILGSKFEAKNYTCSIQVGDSTHGQFTFKGPIKSLDDDKNVSKALEEQYGLIVSLDFAKKFVDDKDMLTLEIEIEDLKPKEEQTDYEEPTEATSANDDKEKDSKKSEEVAKN